MEVSGISVRESLLNETRIGGGASVCAPVPVPLVAVAMVVGIVVDFRCSPGAATVAGSGRPRFGNPLASLRKRSISRFSSSASSSSTSSGVVPAAGTSSPARDLRHADPFDVHRFSRDLDGDCSGPATSVGVAWAVRDGNMLVLVLAETETLEVRVVLETKRDGAESSIGEAARARPYVRRGAGRGGDNSLIVATALPNATSMSVSLGQGNNRTDNDVGSGGRVEQVDVTCAVKCDSLWKSITASDASRKSTGRATLYVIIIPLKVGRGSECR